MTIEAFILDFDKNVRGENIEIEFHARVLNVTNAKAVLRVDDIYTFQASRPIAGGDLGDLKHAKVWAQGGGADNFFGRTIVQPQGNYGVETSFQQPLSAQFELKLRFLVGPPLGGYKKAAAWVAFLFWLSRSRLRGDRIASGSPRVPGKTRARVGLVQACPLPRIGDAIAPNEERTTRP